MESAEATIEEVFDPRRLLERTDLVIQKKPDMKGLTLATRDGEVVHIDKDGCAIISLYNALKIAGYGENFKTFTDELITNDCIDKGGLIIWARFNNLSTGFRFRWMQDREMNCDMVNTNNLKRWVSGNKGAALAKVQSVYAPWRRHFMGVVGIENNSIVCLEPSDKSGVLKLRPVSDDKILGVRYFERTQSSPHIGLSDNQLTSPFI